MRVEATFAIRLLITSTSDTQEIDRNINTSSFFLAVPSKVFIDYVLASEAIIR